MMSSPEEQDRNRRGKLTYPSYQRLVNWSSEAWESEEVVPSELIRKAFIQNGLPLEEDGLRTNPERFHRHIRNILLDQPFGYGDSDDDMENDTSSGEDDVFDGEGDNYD